MVTPGVGKTHLAIGLAIAAAQHGRRVYYGTLADLITRLEEAHASGKLLHRMEPMAHHLPRGSRNGRDPGQCREGGFGSQASGMRPRDEHLGCGQEPPTPYSCKS